MPLLATSPDPSLLAELVVPGIVSLVVALIVAVASWLWNARQQRRASDVQLFAAAYAAVQAYKEFPYVIHRRDPERPGEERVRISEALREVQHDLAFHTAWLRLRNGTVADAYDHLVAESRRIAGEQMHQRWKKPAANSDTDMNVPDLHAHLKQLEPAEQVYLKAVNNALAWYR